MVKTFPVLALLLLLATPLAARACGDSEAPSLCGDANGEAEAKWMLGRVAVALKADHDGALRRFARGEGGFRTVDTYVFCVGQDGVMSAHPSPLLQGQDVTDLHDRTGNYFIRAMMQTAKPGVVSQIRYLFPRPGGTVALPKTTFYTRAEDQVCGVGVYDGEEPIPAGTTPQARAALLQRTLEAGMPPAMRPDWEAFLQAMRERDAARDAALTKARQGIGAAQAALASE